MRKWREAMCRRLILGVVLAMMLAALGCSRKVELRNGISETDANDIVAALLDAGIPSEKEPTKDGYSVKIDEQKMSAAVDVLHAAGLPRDSHAQMGDIFKKDGMISSPLEERSRYLFALSQELERTLGQIDGVLVARVHIVLPERVAPGEPIQPSSAAVFIKYRADVDLEAREFAIRRLVAASIPGLSESATNQIAVVFIPAVGVGSRDQAGAGASVVASGAARRGDNGVLKGLLPLIVAAGAALLAAGIGGWVFRAKLLAYWGKATTRAKGRGVEKA